MRFENKYDGNKVIAIRLQDDDIDSMLINYDLTDEGKYSYMTDEFIEAVINYLPEYAMGHEAVPSSPVKIIPYLREAAKSVVKIKKIDEIKHYLDEKTPYVDWNKEVLKIYNSKGIFSELILHFFLREFKNTISLVSKIYFKDSYSHEAHGFDAVHVSVDDKKLWLGEAKFYNNGKGGIKALIDDLNLHFKHDYLNEQFVIIRHALTQENILREEWIQKLNNATRLEEKLNMVVIPLLCIYEDDIATNIIAEINAGIDADTIYLEHVSRLKEYFDKNNTFINKERVQTLLILLPVESKDKIVSGMLSKIYSLQSI